jgi:hypothetical protein
MLPPPWEAARRQWQAQPQFGFRQTGKRLGQRFIFLYPTARHEPETALDGYCVCPAESALRVQRSNR